MTASTQPSTGTGMPQSMSRVMALGLTSLNSPREKLSTLLRQALRVFSKARLAPVLAEELLDHLPKIAGHDPGEKVIIESQIAQMLGNDPI